MRRCVSRLFSWMATSSMSAVYKSSHEGHNSLVPQILRDFLVLPSRRPCSSNGTKVIRLSYRRITSIRCISLVRLGRQMVRPRLWSICIVLLRRGPCSAIFVWWLLL